MFYTEEIGYVGCIWFSTPFLPFMWWEHNKNKRSTAETILLKGLEEKIEAMKTIGDNFSFTTEHICWNTTRRTNDKSMNSQRRKK